MGTRLKVLISAYACSPFKGSEPGVGWGFVFELSKHHDIWVIVEEEKFRFDIEEWQRLHPEKATHIKFYFLTKRRNRMLRRIWPPSYYWYYRQWHRDALKLAKSLHADVGFNLTHQLTMVGYREPGFLWEMDLPFVWGPVGGMGYFPWRFLGSVGAYGGAYYCAYNVYNWVQVRLLRRPRIAAKCAGAGLVAATSENKLAAYRYWDADSIVIPEVGLPREVAKTPQKRSAGEPLKIVWSGLHTPRKALNIGLKALAQIPAETKWELHVLGAGVQTEKWKKLARSLGIEERCQFHGFVPRENALEIMQTSHVFLMTSLRDLTASVTIEALSLGLPVVCPDHCGFTDVVTDSCGIRVPVISPAQLESGIAEAIQRLELDEEMRLRLANGALTRAKHFSWENKAQKMNAIYRVRTANARIDTLK